MCRCLAIPSATRGGSPRACGGEVSSPRSTRWRVHRRWIFRRRWARRAIRWAARSFWRSHFACRSAQSIPQGARAVLFANGVEASSSTSGDIQFDVPGVGVYRVEVRTAGADVPWIVTNPIYVRGAAGQRKVERREASGIPVMDIEGSGVIEKDAEIERYPRRRVRLQDSEVSSAPGRARQPVRSPCHPARSGPTGVQPAGVYRQVVRDLFASRFNFVSKRQVALAGGTRSTCRRRRARLSYPSIAWSPSIVPGSRFPAGAQPPYSSSSI